MSLIAYLVSNLSVIVDIRHLEHFLDLQLCHLDWEAPHDELELNLGQKLLMNPVFFGSIQLRKRLSTTQHLQRRLHEDTEHGFCV